MGEPVVENVLKHFFPRALPAVERQQNYGGVDHEDVEGHLKHANMSGCLYRRCITSTVNFVILVLLKFCLNSERFLLELLYTKSTVQAKRNSRVNPNELH